LLSTGYVRKAVSKFLAEFYNAFNHQQSANRDINFTLSTFGVISGTAVNARAGQLVQKFGL
jgi:hypothetical protein